VIRFLLLGLLSLFLGAGHLTAAPLGWRSDGTGAYPDARPPTDWSEDHVVWKTKLPGQGFGSPVVVGKRIFVVSDPAELLCINRADGKILWRRSHSLEDLYGEATGKKVTAEFLRLRKKRDQRRSELNKARGDKERQAEIQKQIKGVEEELTKLMSAYPAPPALFNRGSGNAAATPVSDGKRVFALFGNGLACAYTASGDKLWVRLIEPSPNGFGHASSPVLVGDKLLVHFKDLVALQADTGKEVWRDALGPTYATAIPLRIGKTQAVVSPSGAVVRVSDGKILLRNGKLQSSEDSPILDKGIVYVCGGRARAVRLLPGDDDSVKLEQLWESRLAGGRRTPSAVLHGGRLYALTTEGILDVLEAKTGQPVYDQRLNIGDIYASATSAGKYVVIGSTRGTAILIEPAEEFREAARTKIEGFGSSPVFRGQRRYLRTRQYLYCIGE
jgi:outer membrane protein assembly factor BamB